MTGMPIHIRDQHEAATYEGMKHGLVISGAKLMVSLVVFPNNYAATTAIAEAERCGGQDEAKVALILGHVLTERMSRLYNHLQAASECESSPDPRGAMVWLNEKLDEIMPPAGGVQRATADQVQLVAACAEAILRNCLRYSCVVPGGSRWTEETLVARVRSLASVAVSEEWRRRQVP